MDDVEIEPLVVRLLKMVDSGQVSGEKANNARIIILFMQDFLHMDSNSRHASVTELSKIGCADYHASTLR